MGDARHLDTICSEGVSLEERPIIAALVDSLEKLYQLGVSQFDYKENDEGYISKCHLCLDIRKYISQNTDEFIELNPKEFYQHL